MLRVFVKTRLKVARQLLGIIENPRLEFLRIAKVEEYKKHPAGIARYPGEVCGFVVLVFKNDLFVQFTI